MNGWRIAVWRNTELRLHPAVLLVMLYAALTGHLALILISTVSILLHESAHAAAARLCGASLRSIELTPLGAILKTEDTETLPAAKRIFILTAGPLASWLLCLLGIHLSKHQRMPDLSWLLFSANLSILAMNLLPAYPLDGGRVLALLLETFLPKRAVACIMRCIGVTSGFALILLNIYVSWKLGGWNLSLALAGCCLIYSIHAETSNLAMLELRHFLDRKIALESKRSMRASVQYVLTNVPIRDVVRSLPPHRLILYWCVEPGSMKTSGCLTEFEVIQHYMQAPAATLGEALKMSQNRILSSKYDTI